MSIPEKLQAADCYTFGEWVMSQKDHGKPLIHSIDHKGSTTFLVIPKGNILSVYSTRVFPHLR